jgi:hypothetical protein
MINIQPYWLKLHKCRRAGLVKTLAIVCVFVSLTFQNIHAQVNNNFNYEEINIQMNVPRIGNKEIPAVIQGQTLFLSISDVFNFLQIKNTLSDNMDSVSGFFIHPKSTYVIDRNSEQVLYEGVVFNLKPNELLRIESGLYLRSNYFGEIFSLQCDFNFRSLSVNLSTKIELPAIREMQQELMRRNIGLLKNEIKADTIIKKEKSFFRMGMADWGVYSTQQSGSNASTRFDVNLGANIAGGEANAHLYQATGEAFNFKQQYFRWRLVNNKSKFIRQLQVGQVAAQSISSLYASVVGVQITNAPSTYRKSFGSYRLTNTIEPNWTVELYINNNLINYTKSDATGFFSFDVPLVYGNSVVTLKAYGPYGEERIKEEIIEVPFNFLPDNEFEYTISAGMVTDAVQSKFTKANFSYGLTRNITIGGGAEYLSSTVPSLVIPFVNASVRLGSRIMMTGELAYGVRSKAYLSYRLPDNLQYEMTYIKYVKGQTAINVNFSEERRAGFSYLYHAKKISGFTRLSAVEIVYPKFKSTNAEWVISGVVGGIGSSITTTANLFTAQKPYINSNFTLTLRLPYGFTISPQARYDFTAKAVNSVKVEVEKRVGRNGNVTLTYQKSPGETEGTFGMNFRYNFSFAHLAASVLKNKKTITTTESARGSLMYDDRRKSVHFIDQSNVGRGGATVVAFIDLNANGKHDKNEPKALGLGLRIKAGRVQRHDEDSSIRITGLEAYNVYVIELTKTSFDNVAWQIKKPNVQVTIQPNYFTYIEVPVTVMGEISGMVYIGNDGSKVGQGRVIVNIFKDDTTVVAKTLSEPDGYFSYLGLPPGNYSAAIDEAQMAKLNFCCPEKKPFAIKSDMQGDIVGGIDFSIKSTAPVVVPVVAPSIENNSVDTAKANAKEAVVNSAIVSKPGSKMNAAKAVAISNNQRKIATANHKGKNITVAPRKAVQAGKTINTSHPQKISPEQQKRQQAVQKQIEKQLQKKVAPGVFEEFMKFFQKFNKALTAAEFFFWFLLNHP